MRLQYRQEIAGSLGMALLVFGAILTAIGCVLAAVITWDMNASRQHIRNLVGAIQHPSKRQAGDEGLQVMARLLRDLAGLEDGGYRQFVQVRHRKPFDPARDFAELNTAWQGNQLGVGNYPELVRRALADEVIPEEDFPRFFDTWRTVGLIAAIGWAVSSTLFWFMVCWWDGVFTKYHPFSGFQWRTSVTGYAFLVVCFPATLVNAACVGLFYVGYGIMLAWEMPEPDEYVAAGADRAAAVIPVAAAQGPVGTPPVDAQTEPETPLAAEESDQDPGDPVLRRPKHIAVWIAEFVAARERTFTRFAQLAGKANERRFGVAKDGLREAAKALEQAQRAYAAANAQYQRCAGLHRSGVDGERVRRLYDDLWRHPKVRAIHIGKENCVCVYLETTVISDGGARYDIGDFALKIFPETGSFRAIAVRQTSRKRMHPFVDEAGGVCFGTAAIDDLRRFVDEIDYSAFVDFALVMMTKPSTEMKKYWRPIS